MGLHACISMLDLGGPGACTSRKFLENRYSEIASEAILGQKQNHSIATWFADNCIKFLAVHVHLLSQLTWNFYHRRYYGWQNSRRVTSLERQLVNSRAPEIG